MGKTYVGQLPQKAPRERTIHEQLNLIEQEICDDYCKWPGYCREQRKDPDDAETMLYREYCAKCPLSRL